MNSSSRYKSGACPVCGFRAPLTKAGKIGSHRLYGSYEVGGPGYFYCGGAGKDPDPFKYIREGGRRVYA